MDVLYKSAHRLEWREAARWVKFEEKVEDGGNCWSKPYVGTLQLSSLNELKRLLLNGTLMLDIEAYNTETLMKLIVENLVKTGTVPVEEQNSIRTLLLQPHRHQRELNKSSGTNADLNEIRQVSKDELVLDEKQHKNKRFMRKIPAGSEVCNILVGEVGTLKKTLTIFVRLKEALVLNQLTEVPAPTRFLFILLGANGEHFNEIGRAVGNLMCDENFRSFVYGATDKSYLLNGIDEFANATLLIPSAEWDESIRIEPPAKTTPNKRQKQAPDLSVENSSSQADDEDQLRAESGLVRSGCLFGGLINDIKRKAPWYLSDFTDAFNMQCVASWIFLYFACLTPIITFGGLLSVVTHNNIAAIESLVSGLICGVGYGLFAGQPLAVLGSTGPVLVFESIVFQFCQNQNFEYLTFRLWIGVWIAVILLILTAFDASAFVCYITRFTEENFATLISLIFIYEAILNVIAMSKKYPLNNAASECTCMRSMDVGNVTVTEPIAVDSEHCLANNGTLMGGNCFTPDTSNIFLMSIILFLGTFIISTTLKSFRKAYFFSTFLRQFISDFAVIIAIFAMTALDYFMEVPTSKLHVPEDLKPSLPTRGWLISPTSQHNPPWTKFVAIIPALLGTILIFMDQQITAVIINRKENKLKKGCGYHLDLFILSLLILICSIMGLPWFVAATVLSLNHVNSLKKESESAAPGERPQFLGIREQRVTQILIFLTIGVSVFLASLLRHIPMPVLLGVFLYMGVTSLQGLQFYERILIMFMPAKYQPDRAYLRQVPIRRVHLFTAIQLACLIALWLIKSFQQTSILFPLMLVVMIGIRKLLDYVFTQRELKILDDLMPGASRRLNSKQHGEINKSFENCV